MKIGPLLGVLLLVVAVPAAGQQQIVDPDFSPKVARPAYSASGPVVLIDAAHRNFHTADGGYKPFAELLRADGYQVRAASRAFDDELLRGARVLVIANARSPDQSRPRQSAYTPTEADAVRDWVRAGGSLLLIADHSPFGSAAAELAARFGVGMGQGWVFEPADTPAKMTTQLVYSRKNGRLGRHLILNGRGGRETVSSVRTFTGQSLQAPRGAAVLMRLGPEAKEAVDQPALDAVAQALAAGRQPRSDQARPVGSRAQGLALRFGRGRVVVLGEAAMLSAQVVRFPPASGQADIRAGMNVAGYDNQQFALNVLHWLSGVID